MLVAYGDVEHYRPKATYWWLAYSYDNFLASCQLCNQAFKSDFFPIRGKKLRAPRVRRATKDSWIDVNAGRLGPHPLVAADLIVHESEHQAERPLLLNPYLDDPSDYLAWQVDDDLVEIVATPVDRRANRFIRAMDKHFGINRPELKKARYSTFRIYRTFRQVLADPGIKASTRQEVEDQISAMLDPSQPFSGILRYFANVSDADLWSS